VDPAGRLLVSFVVPVLDEEDGLESLYARIVAVMAGEAESYEIVLVDDGSRDRSWERMRALAARDPRVVLVRLSRNFGHQVAIAAGLDHAGGDAVVVLDGDLQDPPEVVPELLALWRAGNDVVQARRRVRQGETLLRRVTAAAFYRILQRLAPFDVPADTGDFRLMSRRVVERMRGIRERGRYGRGLVAWMGFRPAEITYDRAPRLAGESKFPLRKLAAMAIDAIVSSSLVPIRIATALGLASVAASVAVGAWAALTTARAPWSPLLAAILFLGGAQLAAIGVVGEYVGRVLDEARGRPLYLADEVVRGGERTEAAPTVRAVKR